MPAAVADPAARDSTLLAMQPSDPSIARGRRVLSTEAEAVVIARQFEGKRSLQRHQMVYAGLGARMGREIHALSIQAYTPEEWRMAGGGEGLT